MVQIPTWWDWSKAIHQNSTQLQMPFVLCDGSHGIRNIWGSSRARLCWSCLRNQSFQHQQLMRIYLPPSYNEAVLSVWLILSPLMITKALHDGFIGWGSVCHNLSRFMQLVGSWDLNEFHLILSDPNAEPLVFQCSKNAHMHIYFIYEHILNEDKGFHLFHAFSISFWYIIDIMY